MWTWRITLGIFILAMLFGALKFFLGSRTSRLQADHLSLPLTRISGAQLGRPLRFHGRLAGDENHRSFLDQTPCVAYYINVDIVTEYYDSDGDRETEYDTVLDVRRGPEMLRIVQGAETVLVPLSLWRRQREYDQRELQKLPRRAGIVPEPLDIGHGSFLGYTAREVVLRHEQAIFVAGIATKIDGSTAVLAPDTLLDGIELLAGDQQALVNLMGKQSRGQVIGAMIFCGVAMFFVGLLVILELSSRRRRR